MRPGSAQLLLLLVMLVCPGGCFVLEYREWLEKAKTLKDKFYEFEEQFHPDELLKEKVDGFKMLGTGSFGRVFEVRFRTKKNGEFFPVAVKVIKMMSEKVNNLFTEELRLNLQISKLIPDFVAITFTTFKHKEHFFLVGEKLTPLPKRLPATDRLAIAVDVARSLYFFHRIERKKKRVVHCDIKPDNIMLDGSTPPKAKLIDFGVVSDEGSKMIGFSKTYIPPDYAGPALQKNDIYALGVTILEMFTERKYKDETKLRDEILKLSNPFNNEQVFCSFKNVLLKMTLAAPGSRFSALQTSKALVKLYEALLGPKHNRVLQKDANLNFSYVTVEEILNSLCPKAKKILL